MLVLLVLVHVTFVYRLHTSSGRSARGYRRCGPGVSAGRLGVVNPVLCICAYSCFFDASDEMSDAISLSCWTMSNSCSLRARVGVGPEDGR